MPRRRRLASLLPLALSLIAPGAFAGASAYTTLGLTGMADTSPPSLSGSSFQDGVFAAVVPAVGAYAFFANPYGTTQASADLSLLGAVPPAAGAPPLPLSGAARASADLSSGRLGLTASTQLINVAQPSGTASAFSAAYAGAEMGEAFDLLVPFTGAPPGPLQVQLQFALSGLVLDAPNDGTVSLRATLRLTHVAEVVGGVLEQTITYGAGAVNDRLSLTATLIAPECSTKYGVCGYYFSVYGSLESIGTVPIGPVSYAFFGAGDAIHFDDGASLHLLVPTGAVVTDVSTGQGRAWVSAVPEPATVGMWVVGLLGLAMVRRRSGPPG
jgi:hypothetical protein